MMLLKYESLSQVVEILALLYLMFIKFTVVAVHGQSSTLSRNVSATDQLFWADESNLVQELEQFNISKAFLDSSDFYSSEDRNFSTPILESRRQHAPEQLVANEVSQEQQQQQFKKRNHFRITNHVFSRVEFPRIKQFKIPPSRQTSSGPAGGPGAQHVSVDGLFCAVHIGCVDDFLTNIPNLLRPRPNVSASFTIYRINSDGKEEVCKVAYEPVMHHQLDPEHADSSELELEKEFKRNKFKSFVQPKATTPPAPIIRLRLQNNLLQQKQLHQSNKSTAPPGGTLKKFKLVHSQELPFDLSAIESCKFDPTRVTRVIIGGYFAKENEQWINDLVKLWLQLDKNSQVIKVNWPDSNRGLYHSAAFNSRLVARQLSLFLHYLNELHQIDYDKFHLVGHSLGAHIAGFVGSDLSGQVARITGLDPAGPIFLEQNTSMRLDPSDAKFVDVLHTNCGTITKGALGLALPSGHVDYYCNGGSVQPGCSVASVTQSIMNPIESVACNHRRSYRYFAEITRMAIERRSNSLRHISDGSDVENDDSEDTSDHVEDLSGFPSAFIFEPKFDEELSRLTQPNLKYLIGGEEPDIEEDEVTGDADEPRKRDYHATRTNKNKINHEIPFRRQIEFHLLKPSMPAANRRGLYYFKTRPVAPFFGARQYAFSFRLDQPLRRKITLSAKMNETVLGEFDLDDTNLAHGGDSSYLFVFLPLEAQLGRQMSRIFSPRTTNDTTKWTDLWLMWRHKNFNLLLNQQSELTLRSIELLDLDASGDDQLEASDDHVIRRVSRDATGDQSTKRIRFLKGGGRELKDSSIGRQKTERRYSRSNVVILARNQWQRVEGKLELDEP